MSLSKLLHFCSSVSDLLLLLFSEQNFNGSELNCTFHETELFHWLALSLGKDANYLNSYIIPHK